jgi:hypothetical protein
LASQSTFVLKADTSSFLKSIQEAQTRLLGIEKEASTSIKNISKSSCIPSGVL